MSPDPPKSHWNTANQPAPDVPSSQALELEPEDRVLVTGADGFIGSALTRLLIERGARVAALVQPGAEHTNLDGLDVERVEGDLRDPEALQKAADGARLVFHVAAIYRFWAPRRRDFYDVNVAGTRNMIAAARRAACERFVYTSTVGTLGLDSTGAGIPADEASFAYVDHLFGPYKQSKYVAEHEVLRAGAEGLPVVIVQPTTPVGPRDRAPTPTGRIVLDFMNGRLPAFVDTSLNVVHVDDVARGHLLAAEHGGLGRSYILGGENLALRRILALLAEGTGLPRPTISVPRGLAQAAARVSELIEGGLLHREPSVPLEAVRMSTTHMIFSDARARRELGYTSRPVAEALTRAARWYADNGYISSRRLARIRWAQG